MYNCGGREISVLPLSLLSSPLLYAHSSPSLGDVSESDTSCCASAIPTTHNPGPADASGEEQSIL